VKYLNVFSSIEIHEYSHLCKSSIFLAISDLDRTAGVNEAARLIYRLDAGFREMKNGKDKDQSNLQRSSEE